MDLYAANARAGVAIDDRTLTYNGERCDYDHTITALLCISGHLDDRPVTNEERGAAEEDTEEDDCS